MKGEFLSVFMYWLHFIAFFFFSFTIRQKSMSAVWVLWTLIKAGVYAYTNIYTFRLHAWCLWGLSMTVMSKSHLHWTNLWGLLIFTGTIALMSTVFWKHGVRMLGSFPTSEALLLALRLEYGSPESWATGSQSHGRFKEPTGGHSRTLSTDHRIFKPKKKKERHWIPKGQIAWHKSSRPQLFCICVLITVWKKYFLIL